MKKLFLAAAPSLVLLALSAAIHAQPSALEQLWSIPPTSRDYMSTNNNERGVAYNPVTGHVLVVSRYSGNPTMHILDRNTGADLGTVAVPTNIVTGGTFALSMIGVGADGAIYGANLTVASSTTPLKVYRWANEGATPTIAYSGDPGPGPRWGDTFDVRGSGVTTQILLGSRTNTIAALLTTADGTVFAPSVINTTGVSGGDFGLGIAFGAGNTFWGKGSSATTLQFMRLSGGAPIQSYTTAAFTNVFSNIALDPANNLLAAISIATPDRILLYDIAKSQSASNSPVLLEAKVLPTDFANINATGSADFGDGKLFVLDTNNGLIAYRVTAVPEPTIIALSAVAAGWLFCGRGRKVRK